MREIKFRAWSNKYKHMFRVREISQNRDGYTHGTIDAEFKDEHTAEFDNPYVWVGRVDFTLASDGRKSGLFQDPDDEPFILMQYTGLKDMNGKEIYEDDIVRVYFGSDEDDYYLETIKYESGGYWVECGESCLGAVHTFTAVIGNIHENPELLEQTT